MVFCTVEDVFESKLSFKQNMAAALARTASSVDAQPDDYMRLKDLERQLEFLEIQEDYIKVRLSDLLRGRFHRPRSNTRSDTTTFLLPCFAAFYRTSRRT